MSGHRPKDDAKKRHRRSANSVELQFPSAQCEKGASIEKIYAKIMKKCGTNLIDQERFKQKCAWFENCWYRGRYSHEQASEGAHAILDDSGAISANVRTVASGKSVSNRWQISGKSELELASPGLLPALVAPPRSFFLRRAGGRRLCAALLGCDLRTGLNYSFGTKKYCHQIRKFHGIIFTM